MLQISIQASTISAETYMKIKARSLALERAKHCNRGCFVTGLRVLHGHNVSNSNIKTHRLFKQNISNKKIYSDAMGQQELKISRRGQRTIEKYGGLDMFLKNYKPRKMTFAALQMRKTFLKMNPEQNEAKE